MLVVVIVVDIVEGLLFGLMSIQLRKFRGGWVGCVLVVVVVGGRITVGLVFLLTLQRSETLDQIQNINSASRR